LEKREFEVYVPAMPDSDNPKIEAWVLFLKNLVGKCDNDTYFIGHSMGCRTIIKYLGNLEENEKAGGAVFVAGWVSLTPMVTGTEEEKEIVRQWLAVEVNYEKARAYLSDNMKAQYPDDNWVPMLYGIQDGPTSVKFISENDILNGFKKIDDEVLKQFKLVYKEGEIKKGRNLLAFEVAKRNVSNFLKLPISTVHYHLQKLTEAKLVEIQEFHYSVKGREVNHYQLANKYIIIAPGKVSGLKQKLKGLLPAALAAAGISAVIKVIQSNNLSSTAKIAAEAGPEIARALDSTVQPAQSTLEASLPTIALAPDLALWFLIGSIAALALYLLIEIIREKFK